MQNAAASGAEENVEGATEEADVLSRKFWQFQFCQSARTVTDFSSLVAILRKFKGKEIVLTSFVRGEDPETYDLCNALFLAASNAEMQAINLCGKEPPSTPPRTAVLVYVSDDYEKEEFVKNSSEFYNVWGAGGMPARPGSPLTILVGSQPPFSMDSKERFNPPPIRRKNSRPSKKP
jgi:hypothetical protein